VSLDTLAELTLDTGTVSCISFGYLRTQFISLAIVIEELFGNSDRLTSSLIEPVFDPLRFW
jgi:hypothetical protein